MCKPFTRSRRSRSLKVSRSFALAVLSVVVLTLISDKGWSQRRLQPRTNTPAQGSTQQEKLTIVPTPAIDPASALGQALASCNKISELQESFSLPGLKGEVILDHCYKGRNHLVCVFNALISELKSLIDSYTKIVDAKYPEYSSVDNICKLKRDSLLSDITGAEDFTKRFAVLRSQYESSSKCAVSIKQAFQNVVLTDMSQPPELLKSMNDSVDGDINRVSEAEKQVVDLAEKMQASTKSMKTIDKIHRTMCLKESAETSPPKENTESSAPKDKKD